MKRPVRTARHIHAIAEHCAPLAADDMPLRIRIAARDILCALHDCAAAAAFHINADNQPFDSWYGLGELLPQIHAQIRAVEITFGKEKP